MYLQCTYGVPTSQTSTVRHHLPVMNHQPSIISYAHSIPIVYLQVTYGVPTLPTSQTSTVRHQLPVIICQPSTISHPYSVPTVYLQCTYGVPTLYLQVRHWLQDINSQLYIVNHQPSVIPIASLQCTYSVPTVYLWCTYTVPKSQTSTVRHQLTDINCQS